MVFTHWLFSQKSTMRKILLYITGGGAVETRRKRRQKKASIILPKISIIDLWQHLKNVYVCFIYNIRHCSKITPIWNFTRKVNFHFINSELIWFPIFKNHNPQWRLFRIEIYVQSIDVDLLVKEKSQLKIEQFSRSTFLSELQYE